MYVSFQYLKNGFFSGNHFDICYDGYIFFLQIFLPGFRIIFYSKSISTHILCCPFESLHPVPTSQMILNYLLKYQHQAVLSFIVFNARSLFSHKLSIQFYKIPSLKLRGKQLLKTYFEILMGISLNSQIHLGKLSFGNTASSFTQTFHAPLCDIKHVSDMAFFRSISKGLCKFFP